MEKGDLLTGFVAAFAEYNGKWSVEGCLVLFNQDSRHVVGSSGSRRASEGGAGHGQVRGYSYTSILSRVDDEDDDDDGIVSATRKMQQICGRRSSRWWFSSRMKIGLTCTTRDQGQYTYNIQFTVSSRYLPCRVLIDSSDDERIR